MSSLMDPFGHRWDLASHVRDVTPEEMAAAVKQFAKGQSLSGPGQALILVDLQGSRAGR